MNHTLNLTMAFHPPDIHSWMGYDSFGNPLQYRLIDGALFSLSTSLISAVISICIAVLISLAQMYSPNFLSNIISKLINGLLAFPGLLLAILCAVILPPSNFSIIFVLTLTSWAGSSRVFYALMKSNLNEEYIIASKAFGATNMWIFKTHLIRKLKPFIFIQFLFIFMGTLLAESSLSFLGLGSPLDSPSWGRLIAQGRQYLIEAPHLSIFPGITLFLTLFLLHSLGNYFQNKQNFTKIR